ncbi:MAG: VCBS repeat-containing protein, partial [Planctomycetaceae bacterium]|nr:VCBS repeat-containing protein [Planctomycetaceae bacterium]
MRRTIATALALAGLAVPAAPPSLAAAFPTFSTQEIDPHVGDVCYSVTTADVNGDRKPDVVAVTEEAVVWFANPTWEKHVIIRGATQRDNVCIQAHDIDGDGRVDFALGAA